MCLITLKPFGKLYTDYDIESLDYSIVSNPDSHGICIKYPDYTLDLYRDLTPEAFFDLIDYFNTKDYQIVTHNRFATSGIVNSVDNCHPFPLLDNNLLDRRQCNPSAILAHNGVIHDFSHFDKDHSDTFWLVRMLNAYPELLNSDQLDKSFGTSNRIIIMYEGDSPSDLIGRWYKRKGIYYSVNPDNLYNKSYNYTQDESGKWVRSYYNPKTIFQFKSGIDHTERKEG